MTDQQSGPEKIMKSAIDGVTVFSAMALGGAAVSAGPVAGGIAAGIFFPVIAYSMMGILCRTVVSNNEMSEHFATKTGIAITMEAGKNMASCKKAFAAGALVMGFSGGLVGIVTESFRQSAEERKAYNKELVTLPVLSAQTVFKTDVYTAADLYCINRHGNPLRTGTEVPVMHKGTKYKIICP